LGMAPGNVVVCLDGQSVQLTDAGMELGPETSGAMIYVDGRVGGVDEDVLQERRVLGENGFVAVFVVIDDEERAVVDGPTVVSRGWSIDDDLDELEDAIAKAVRESLVDMLKSREPTRKNIERVMRRSAGSTVADLTRRRPMIIPTVTFAR
jgi:ribonuclease J